MHNQIVGKVGEDLAIKYLIAKGYQIIDRNVKTSYQEIDIVARYFDLYIFVEVKTVQDTSKMDPEDNMSRKKHRSLKWALMRYCYQNKISLYKIRLDLVAIILGSDGQNIVRHYEDII